MVAGEIFGLQDSTVPANYDGVFIANLQESTGLEEIFVSAFKKLKTEK